MGLLFALLFYALVLMAVTAMLVVWGMLWILGAVLGLFYVVIGDTARARRAVMRSPPRVVSQAKWSNRR